MKILEYCMGYLKSSKQTNIHGATQYSSREQANEQDIIQME